MIIIAILLWMVPAFIITYGLSFAYWQGKFPTIAKEGSQEDIIESLFFALVGSILGPVGIIMALCSFSGYGFKFK